ncbi:MAG TPA: aminoacyl-tRNA hydrolase [Candidatus Saccharimonadales bacterium]|nr:aminoacyl-tRNA hydrolase [Candidatus Saccharimonadales bacterium]
MLRSHLEFKVKLIVGLGNPGIKYAKNRHNVGFMVVEAFASVFGVEWRYSQDWVCHFAKSEEYILVKPSTYMNESGEAVRAVANYFSVKSGDVLIVHDEVDLEFGKIRLTFNGSSAGHHGVESVNKSLGTQDFARLRIGVGRPSAGEAGLRNDKPPIGVDRYVLADFTEDEQAKLADIIAKCGDAIKSYLAEGIVATMNKFN